MSDETEILGASLMSIGKEGPTGTRRIMESNYMTLAALARQTGYSTDGIRVLVKRLGIPLLQVPWKGSAIRMQLAIAQNDALFLQQRRDIRQYPHSGKGMPGKGWIDMAGQHVGRWTFLEFRGTTQNGRALWLCRCDCGSEKVMEAIVIRGGWVKSCGCLRKETIAKLVHNNLVAYQDRAIRLGKRNKGHRNLSESRHTWRCLMCGSDFGDALAKDRKFRAKSRFCTTGCWYNYIRLHPDQHPLWNGGTIPYYGPDWDSVAAKVRSRDQHTCQHCGLQQTRPALHVHHMQPLRSFDATDSGNAMSNLITLCRRCHTITEAKLRQADRESVRAG